MNAQRNEIPSIRLWDLLLVPLQGEVSDEQVERLTSHVLEQLHQSDATGLILDVTGLWLLDSHLCAALSRLAAASRLMGAKTVMCGLAPEIAITLQTMGLSLRELITVPSLEEALVRLGVAPIGMRASPTDVSEGLELDACRSETSKSDA